MLIVYMIVLLLSIPKMTKINIDLLSIIIYTRKHDNRTPTTEIQ